MTSNGNRPARVRAAAARERIAAERAAQKRAEARRRILAVTGAVTAVATALVALSPSS
jgi:hypothetical protein